MSNKKNLAEQAFDIGKLVLRSYVDPAGAARKLAEDAGIDLDPKKRPRGDVVVEAEIDEDDNQ